MIKIPVVSFQDLLDTVYNCLMAAGGPSDIDELQKEVNAAGPKPSHFVKAQFDKLNAQISELKDKNANLSKELMNCRYSRVDLDCRYTIGNVADISGRHCEGKRCTRCQYEIEAEEYEEEIKKLKQEIDDLNEQLKRYKNDILDSNNKQIQEDTNN
jgi:cell division protein FtsB